MDKIVKLSARSGEARQLAGWDHTIVMLRDVQSDHQRRPSLKDLIEYLQRDVDPRNS